VKANAGANGKPRAVGKKLGAGMGNLKKNVGMSADVVLVMKRGEVAVEFVIEGMTNGVEKTETCETDNLTVHEHERGSRLGRKLF
jgi:hypothetical protein